MTDRPKRKAIPASVKNAVLVRQGYRCAECKQTLLGGPVDYDHRPALIMRPVNAEGTDYIPPQNDPDHIEALHPRPCHLRRSVGRAPGAEKTATSKGSDVWLAKKFRKLERNRNKDDEISGSRNSNFGRKAKIPSRPFPKRKP